MITKEMSKHTFWLWIIMLGITWVSGLLQAAADALTSPWRLMGSALFFGVFFISPLWRKRPLLLTVQLFIASLLCVAVLWPEQDGQASLYSLLVMSILAGYAVLSLPSIHACIIGIALILGALAPYVAHYPSLPPVSILIYAVLLAVSLMLFRILWQRTEEYEARNEALLNEYRKMKRRIASDEEIARQEERTQIGRDIHDSVGHKLTALMMQLEVFRMQAEGEAGAQLQKLKELAQESLQETRSAVKSLKSSEPGGLPAILRLIRKLEAESILKIHFTVKYGALSAPLTNEQSIAVYRAVQEALTNIMKHSKSREADILFEAPGGSVFRFEVSNPSMMIDNFREGFGLRSMRERIEGNHGKLDIISSHDRFIVRGTLLTHLHIRKAEDAL